MRRKSTMNATPITDLPNPTANVVVKSVRDAF